MRCICAASLSAWPSVVAHAVDLYRDVAEAKGITLTAQTADDVVVTADGTRLEQVAANLIDNALKYTPAGGRVDVEVLRDGDRARLRVRDTGIGIPSDELPRIWDRLFRGDTSRTERGLGLGLSLVKAVVEAHGGTVEVAKPAGQGFGVHRLAADRSPPRSEDSGFSAFTSRKTAPAPGFRLPYTDVMLGVRASTGDIPSNGLWRIEAPRAQSTRFLRKGHNHERTYFF